MVLKCFEFQHSNFKITLFTTLTVLLTYRSFTLHISQLFGHPDTCSKLIKLKLKDGVGLAVLDLYQIYIEIKDGIN